VTPRRPRARARCAALAFALACAAAVALPACERETPAATAPGRSAASARETAPARGASPAANALSLPPPGEVRVARRAARFDLAANEAPALLALEELSVHAGFRVERAAGEPAAREPRTVWLHDVSAARAANALLAGIEHHLHYEFADGVLDPSRPFEGREVILARVTIGALADAPAAEASRGGHSAARAPGAGRLGRAGERSAAEAPAPDPPAARRGDAGTPAPPPLDEDLARGLRDPDPDVRLEALEQLDPEGPQQAHLAALVREDPSPEVRVAAAERLAEGDPFAATPPLLAALADPDPAVVEAAVLALEDVYDAAPDPRIRESVAVLREHRDPAVREAVESFESWVEE